MALKTAGFIPIPPGKQPGFDHAYVYRHAAPATSRLLNCVIYQRIAEIQLGDTDRQCAKYALRDAEAIADAVIWVKQRIASLGAMLPKLGFSTRRRLP